MNPQNTALVLIGFQNDYFAQDGILKGVIEESAIATNTVENTVRLLENLVNTPILLISTPIFLQKTTKNLLNRLAY